MKKLVVMRALLLSFLISFSAVSPAYEYVINVSESLDNSVAGEYLEKYLTLAYEKVGITPTFKYYPSGRGLQKVSAGELDADAGRLHPVMQHYRGLTRVDEPLGEVQFGVFCLQSSGCNSSPGTYYGSQSGSEMSKMVCSENDLACIPMSKAYDLAKLLEAFRVSGLLLPLHNAPEVLCHLNNKQVYYRTFPSSTFFSYHYLSDKNKGLHGALSDAIRELKEEVDVSSILGNTWKTRLNACRVLLEDADNSIS